jgi:hypothetical protein
MRLFQTAFVVVALLVLDHALLDGQIPGLARQWLAVAGNWLVGQIPG